MLLHLPAVRAYKRDAHLIIPRCAETELGRAGSKIGGLPYLTEHERWPICKDCRRPMRFIFQINFNDLPSAHIPLRPYNMLSFYYCFSCMPNSSSDPGGAHLTLREIRKSESLQSAGFALHDPDSPEPIECSLSFRPFEDLPPAETIVELMSMDQQALEGYERYVEQLRGGKLEASKIGGYPHWLLGNPTYLCRCGTTMRFLGQIGSCPKANLVWNDSGILYLFYCPQICHNEALAFTIQAA